MRTMTCSSGFLRLLVGGVLAYYSTTPPAAPRCCWKKQNWFPRTVPPKAASVERSRSTGTVAVVTANPQQATMGSGPDLPSAAYVFERQASGAWTQTAKLTTGLEGDGALSTELPFSTR